MTEFRNSAGDRSVFPITQRVPALGYFSAALLQTDPEQ